ncbi:integral peroxisomal membrane peroxin-domain-containing protein [Clohesyomyces aquaticus]|uniref:Integral peroxisomal membrane peroxin-domain-containing protein n=1 Tax=Clohesyomyces aquaticus TaxID=1231657 RepID=A0A1Y2A5R2_9PLEO|nr:integral peroxisomal membrane peroxin-domain-containing protein [Clohesyomyces aquaticus]
MTSHAWPHLASRDLSSKRQYQIHNTANTAPDTPWIDHMSSPSRAANDASPTPTGDPNPPTYAAFSPSTLGQATPQTKLRSAILVHQKSPLLAATPPQVTRILAYSHPFLLPLNKLVGLLTWTTGDPWESFLLVATFWAVVLYGDVVTRYAGPIIVVLGLILGMYARRYSPLSSTGWTGEKGQKGHKRAESESNTKHHKSLEDIVDTLKLFTSRCNILLDPFLQLTDFLSTQRTATSATTRPALTTLFVRISFVTPLWIILTLPPFYIISTKRVVLAVGTVVLTWHSRPARVTRTILWRSKMVRRVSAAITGLQFAEIEPKSKDGAPALPPRRKSAQEIAASLAAKRRPDSPGVRFTFTIFENQRRWLGIGWTSSMLAYERGSWTDEHLNSTPSKDDFELPEVEGGHARWRWVQGSEWKIEGTEKGGKDKDGASGDAAGWIYYDNKWRDGRRGVDGWGRYTRHRKWYRDAELVEVTPSTEVTPIPTPKFDPVRDASEPPTPTPKLPGPADTANGQLSLDDANSAMDDTDTASTKSKRSWFKRRSRSAAGSDKAATVASSSSTNLSRRSDEDDVHSPLERNIREDEWRLGDDIRMQLDI